MLRHNILHDIWSNITYFTKFSEVYSEPCKTSKILEEILRTKFCGNS